MNEETKQSTIKRLGEQIIGVFKWVWGQWQNNPLTYIIVGLLIGFVALEYYLFFIAGWEWADWTGFGEYTDSTGKYYYRAKTLWDLVELLIVPIVLAIGAWWLNKSERENEREIAQDNRNQATLEAYFDRMTELFLEKGLQESKEGDTVRSIARTRTLAVLRSVDGKRKRQVLLFLRETKLIGLQSTISLMWANLSEAELNRVNLPEVNLHRAYLLKTNLVNAILIGANLSMTDLRWANLTEG